MNGILKGKASWILLLWHCARIDTPPRLSAERPMGLNYRCVLVDEIQDLGTVELEVVNALSKLATNQLFLTGDPRQQVFPKEHNLRAAGIEVRYRRSFRKNYRNPRQILEAGVAMMQQFDDESGRADEESEPLDPQYSARESPRPVVIHAETPDQEREHIVRYVEETRKSHNNPICVVACSLREDDEAGMAKLLADYKRVGLKTSPLGWNSAVQQRAVFLSALETVKGFEFSLVILSECNANVIPNPALPNEEHWRDARRLYVAMTRARDELVMTHTGEPSRFLQGCRETLQWRSVREEGLVGDDDKSSADTEASPAPAENDNEPTPELMREIEKLSAENQQLRTQLSHSKPDLRVSPKGGMSLYGLGRFPVTLYKDQWLRLLGAENQIRSFIRDNAAKLSVKNKT
ncbi:MAG: 3'-5' exonuclease [Deltaproteobacteria bacterium]|nr:3'-5' exonuclease [Deltaproteobacteria bacterium]MDZ4340865.1 3'-5' exonuclease [Candidatus Binatia bacterium]